MRAQLLGAGRGARRALKGVVATVAVVAASTIGLSGVTGAAPTSAPTTTTITVTGGASATVAYGTEVFATFGVTVTGAAAAQGYPTGTVTILTASTLPVGTCGPFTHSGNVATFSCILTTTEFPASTTPYTLHAHYTGGPSSDLTYLYGASTSKTATTSKTVALTVAKGTYPGTTFTVSISGASSKSVTYGVPTSVALAETGLPASGSVSFTTAVTGSPTTLCTTLTLSISTSCDYTTASLPAAGYTIAARWSGNADYDAASSTGTLTLTVTKATYAGTFTIEVTGGSAKTVSSGPVTLSEGGLPETSGGKVSFTATVASVTTTLCSFTLSATTTSCSYTTDALAIGSYTVDGHWSGGSDYRTPVTPSDSVVLTKGSLPATPDPVGTDTTLSVSSGTHLYGAETQVTFSGTVSESTGHGRPTGSVTVSIETTSPSTTKASVTCPLGATAATTTASTYGCHLGSGTSSVLDAGTYDVQARYPGTAGGSYPFTASTSSIQTLAISPAAPPAFTAWITASKLATSKAYGSTVALSETGLPSTGGGTVTFWVGTTFGHGTSLCTFTLAIGKSSCTYAIALAPGATAYDVHVHWAGDANYSAATGTDDVALTVTKGTLAGTTFDVEVTSSSASTSKAYASTVTLSETGLPVNGGGTVSFWVGSSYASGTQLCSFTLSSTTASCTYAIALAPTATYRVHARWTGNADYSAGTSTTSVLLTVTKAPSPPPFTVEITGSKTATSALYGATVTVSETGLPATGGGTVSVWEGTGAYTSGTPLCSFTLAGGTTSCTYTIALATTATYPVLAHWAGNTEYEAGTSANSVDLTVSTATSNATRVYGETADATAAAEFTRAFPYQSLACPGSRTAVLATTKVFQDALSSQYLAGHFTTGTLLTPTGYLSAVTATVLRHEGITTVYIVGGPLAVSTTVAVELEGTTAYGCGGTSLTGAKLTVRRLWGETQYGTAKAVAEFVDQAPSLSLTGAYATTNATGGTGRFNDTAGKGTSAPTAAGKTAILASGVEFQDAQSASVIAYHTHLPLLLTPATSLSTTAVTAIKTLGVTQVILMGGQLAVSNAVEAALVQATGVSVLRIAGKDGTDTAVQLARFETAAPPSGLGWTPGHRVMVARGDFFTDGLCGAVLDSPHNTTTGPAGTVRPLLLTESPTVVGSYLATFLSVTGHTGINGTAAKTIRALTVLGGPLAVTTATVTAMLTELDS